MQNHIETGVTSFVNNQLEAQNEAVDSRARSISKDSAEETRSLMETQARTTTQQLQELNKISQTQIQEIRNAHVQDRQNQEGLVRRQEEQFKMLTTALQDITKQWEGSQTEMKKEQEAQSQVVKQSLSLLEKRIDEGPLPGQPREMERWSSTLNPQKNHPATQRRISHPKIHKTLLPTTQ